MKIKLLYAFIIGALLYACSDDDNNTGYSLISEMNTDSITFVTNVENPEYEAIVLVFTNLTTKEQTTVDYGEPFSLLGGIYDVEVSATGSANGVACTFYGTATSVVIANSQPSFVVKLYMRDETTSDFLIEEIFFTGTLYPSGAQYHGDNYVKLYNNTDHTLYADGIALVESKFTSTQKFDYTPDIREDTMTVQALYVVPGSGTEHPVEPGHSFILCDIGIDHRATNENSFDLSSADYEWYDVSTHASTTDIDSEIVPNLDKWYCYTESIWILHNRGFKSYALVRMPAGLTKEDYLRDYYYSYSYVISVAAGDFPMTQSSYKIPNAWIVDGVNCSVETDRQWDILPPSIDAGWTHCGYSDKDQSRYFKSVRRKMIALDENGNRILQDTNNSTNDFNTECVPSLAEEQHTAIDVDGTLATTITYDGVTVKE